MNKSTTKNINKATLKEEAKKLKQEKIRKIYHDILKTISDTDYIHDKIKNAMACGHHSVVIYSVHKRKSINYFDIVYDMHDEDGLSIIKKIRRLYPEYTVYVDYVDFKYDSRHFNIGLLWGSTCTIF